MRLKFFPICLLLLPLIAFAENDKELSVGVIQSLTGMAAEDGKTVVQALRLASEDLAKRGIRVNLLTEDDQTTQKNGITALHKLMTSKPDVIVAATWDFTTNPLLPVAAQYQVPIFNTSTLPESLDLTSSKGFAFINAISVKSESEPFRRFLTKVPHSKIAIVYANNSWGDTQLKIYKKIAEDLGASIVDEFKPSSFDENEWRILIPRIKEKNPSLVVLLLNKNDILVFLQRAKELGMTSKFFTSKNGFDAFRISKNKGLFNGTCFTYPLERFKRETEFTNRYAEKFGEEPRIYADNTYDALCILSAAKDISKQKEIPFQDALKQVKYTGLVGNYSYNGDNSFSLGSSSLVCVENEALKTFN